MVAIDVQNQHTFCNNPAELVDFIKTLKAAGASKEYQLARQKSAEVKDEKAAREAEKIARNAARANAFLKKKQERD